jgi:hypothetical protein
MSRKQRSERPVRPKFFVTKTWGDRATQHLDYPVFQPFSGNQSTRVPNAWIFGVDDLFFCICQWDTGALALTLHRSPE